MRYLTFLLYSKGRRQLYSRAFNIFQRFGFSEAKSERYLTMLIKAAKEYDCQVTFPITAVTLKRHAALVKRLLAKGGKFAIHGYVHTDYTQLSREKQTGHLEKAIQIFEKYGIPYQGFRFPYLKCNHSLVELTGAHNFSWVSSAVFDWRVVQENIHGLTNGDAYRRARELLYRSLAGEEYCVVPRLSNGFVEIPSSLPDDEMIVDRLGITDGKEIKRIWNEVLTKTYLHGELFTIVFHHERTPVFLNALKEILREARERKPPIWVASIDEIASWWKEKSESRVELESRGRNRYALWVRGPERLSLLFKGFPGVNGESEKWFNGYFRTEKKKLELESSRFPGVGISPNSAPGLKDFLEKEGFLVRATENREECSVYLDERKEFYAWEEKAILEKIDDSPGPLLRIWRWPEGARSALCINSDVDSITIGDFFRRVFEF